MKQTKKKNKKKKNASGGKQSFSFKPLITGCIPEGADNTEFSLLKLDGRFVLMVYGDCYIPVSDYKVQSSADGETELCVTIKGIANVLEIKASLKG